MVEGTDGIALPGPLVVCCAGLAADALLEREWLVTNRLGAYASGSVAGTNTRRYHGLLVAATRPPAGRVVALSCLLDQFLRPVSAGDPEVHDLATFEWVGKFLPDGRGSLVEFRNAPAAAFLYRCGQTRLLKEVLLAEQANVVAVRYRLLEGPEGLLRLRPFAALRDYHALGRAEHKPQMTYAYADGELWVEDPPFHAGALRLTVRAGPQHGSFHVEPGWWHRFRYRADLARGQEGQEDLYTAGWFEVPLTARQPVQLTAALNDAPELDFEESLARKRVRLASAVAALGEGADELACRLAAAADAFVAVRHRPGGGSGPRPAVSAGAAGAGPRPGPAGSTLLAGYPWFADWGRDAMIALPGLLLETGRYQEALEVLRTFAAAMDGGMIPNCFDEYGGPAQFNSVDASLWFVLAADRYVAASGDASAWASELAGAVESVVEAYHDGTRFSIHADEDGLLTAGDAQTHLTWMDVKLAGQPVTPRWGKCVEVNALWLAALRVAARRCGDPRRADRYDQWARRAAEAFAPTFWNESDGCLYDCVRAGEKDSSLRPNQIIAIALPDCPLPTHQQRLVVQVVQRELLTPYGLRTLGPGDRRYRGRYGISWESRDRAYHQGTVWPWLLGPFVEAYLRVHGFSEWARRQARQFLAAFPDHLAAAGVGFISEIFDGNPPHDPCGCIAQAWSVGEILRAQRLIDRQP